MGDTQVCETPIGRAVLHRSKVYTAALEKELGVEQERETRRLEGADALMRKAEDGAAVETERQRRIRRGQAAQAARFAALGITRDVREAERQAEHDEQTEQALVRLLTAQEKQHEEHRLAHESANASRRRRQVESEAQTAARNALHSSAVSASHVRATARIDELGSTVQTIVAERREQRARRMEDLSRHQAGREEDREKQVAGIGALGRRAEANVDAARAEAQRRRHAAAEARRVRQRAATAIRREQDAKLEREARAVMQQGLEEDAEWVRRWANRGFDLVSRDLGGRRSTSSAPSPNLTPQPGPNLTPRPPPDQPTPRVAGIEERAVREREKLLRMDERLKATEAQVCVYSARTAHAQRTHSTRAAHAQHTHCARTPHAHRTRAIEAQACRHIYKVRWSSLRTHLRPPPPPLHPCAEATQRGPAGAARYCGSADARGFPQDARKRGGGQERPAHRLRRVRRAPVVDADPRLRPHHAGALHLRTSAHLHLRLPGTPANPAPTPPRPAHLLGMHSAHWYAQGGELRPSLDETTRMLRAESFVPSTPSPCSRPRTAASAPPASARGAASAPARSARTDGSGGGGARVLFQDKAATQPHKNAFRPTTRRCALCEVEFETKNLGFTVTHNAIHRLRSRWGAPSTAAARSVATLYNAAHVCIFCTQFFCSEMDRSQGPGVGLR